MGSEEWLAGFAQHFTAISGLGEPTMNAGTTVGTSVLLDLLIEDQNQVEGSTMTNNLLVIVRCIPCFYYTHHSADVRNQNDQFSKSDLISMLKNIIETYIETFFIPK